jgi:hypothetical protein
METIEKEPKKTVTNGESVEGHQKSKEASRKEGWKAGRKEGRKRGRMEGRKDG